MRGYRAPPGPPVVMTDIPPVTGVADLEARLKRRLAALTPANLFTRGPVGWQPVAFSLSDCEGGLRSIAAGKLADVSARLLDCLGAAGCIAIGPRETIMTEAGAAILAEIDYRRARGAA